MNIGDGLTLQSQTVGGKTTSGIFFLPSKSSKSQKHIASKSVKRPGNLNSKSNEDHNQVTKSKAEDKRKKNTTLFQTKQISESKSDDVIFIDNNARKDVEDKRLKNKTTNSTSTERIAPKTKKESAPSQEKKKVLPKQKLNTVTTRDTTKQGKKVTPNEIKIDTNFVTLTQDQLNTILNLVKTKQEIDIATVMKEEPKTSQGSTSEKKKSSEEKRVEPTSVPGLDFDQTSEHKSESKADSDKENYTTENVAKLLEKVKTPVDGGTKSTAQSRSSSRPKSKENNDSSTPDAASKKKSFTAAELSGTLGGYGSRDKEKSRLEERRKKWIADLNEQVERKKQLQQSSSKEKSPNKADVKSSSTNFTPAIVATQKSSNVRSTPNSASEQRKDESVRSNSSSFVDQVHESLPTAMRSSFFLGEAAPREHAFSAKKRQEQQAWRGELEKQIKEKEKIKQQKTTKNVDESDMWTRHFETMNPAHNKTQQPSLTNQEHSISPDTTHHTAKQPVTSPQKQSPRNPAFNSDNISGIYSGDHTTNSTDPRVQSNYLRSMTALLDPSQLEAMELKRQKQQEHRRIIAEQVEEKRRFKEAEMRAKKEEEELEEKRLEEERRQLKNQFEREKNKQQAIEEKRDRQTQELYQQVKEAEATALKEKFERRQQSLRNHGHDTSRLERTHKHTLEKNMPSHHHLTTPPPMEHIPSLNIKDITSHHDLHESPRAVFPIHASGEPPPFTVMTNNGQIPIKLEISLNHKHGDLVARAVQTDDVTVKKKANRKNDTLLDILSDSDTETQYMDLPYPSARHNDKKSRKTKASDREQEARNRHYNRYSRTNKLEEEVGVERERKVSKPKWGVGEKKKRYVPASNKYVSSKREKEERENRIRRREEQLLAEQARNQPERLTAATSKFKADDNPALNAADNHRPQRKERSHSPQERTSYHSTNRNRSSSPPVPALKNQMRTERSYNSVMSNKHAQNRPDTAISVTTEQAKYQSSKHSPDSPVPDTDDFVEYRRSDVILDPNQPQTRPNTEKEERNYHGASPDQAQPPSSERSKDPLLNADMLKQKDRQDRILKEISILRQGLLLKQREVASYPVAVTTHHPGKNLPERTNDVTMT